MWLEVFVTGARPPARDWLQWVQAGSSGLITGLVDLLDFTTHIYSPSV